MCLAVLPKDGWFAVGGEASAGRVDEANEKWRLLAGARPPPFRYNGASGGRAAFVGMKRDFYFKKPFSTSGASHLAWGPGKLLVQSYGAIGGTADEYTGTVRILAYRPVEGCIALQLLGAESDDTLVLYQPAKNQKMIDAMRWVKIWRERWETHEGASLAWNDKFPHRGDDLRFPEIRLGAQTDCSDDFKGAFWLKDVTQSQQVTQAAISMRLEANGITAPDSPARAVVESDPPPLSKPVTGVPRRFWINRHFFAFFWRDGAAWPYAAVWFGSSEGLVK